MYLVSTGGAVRAPHHVEPGGLVGAELQDVQEAVAHDRQGGQLDHVDVEGLFDEDEVVGRHEEAVGVGGVGVRGGDGERDGRLLVDRLIVTFNREHESGTLLIQYMWE